MTATTANEPNPANARPTTSFILRRQQQPQPLTHPRFGVRAADSEKGGGGECLKLNTAAFLPGLAFYSSSEYSSYEYSSLYQSDSSTG